MDNEILKIVITSNGGDEFEVGITGKVGLRVEAALQAILPCIQQLAEMCERNPNVTFSGIEGDNIVHGSKS